VKYFKVREIVNFMPIGAVKFILTLTLGEFFCNYGNEWGGGGGFTESPTVVNYKIWLQCRCFMVCQGCKNILLGEKSPPNE